MNDLRKALFRALEKSDINMLRTVLAQGVSLAYEAGDPDPVCFVGAPYDGVYFDALCFLQAVGANLVTREAEYQDTLLHWCVRNTDERLLPWLIAQGLDVNAQNIKGRTPLVFASYGVHPGSDADRQERAMRDVRLLVEAGADVNLADESGTAILHIAADNGVPELVSYLLSHGANANAAKKDGETPLHTIALRGDVGSGHVTIIDLLLAAGADIDALDKDRHPPLVYAGLGASNVAVAHKLIACGADIDANSGGPIRMVMDDENSEIFDLLLSAGVRLDFVDHEGLPLIGLAANNNCLHGLKTLLDRGVDIDTENVDGETPLIIAAWQGHYDAVKLLLSRGANRQHVDHYSNTALSWATRRRDARLIELLTS